MNINKRVFGIIDESINGNTQELINSIANNNYTDCIYIFTKFNKKYNGPQNINLNIINIPSEKNNRPKMKNFAIKYIKNLGIFNRLHLLEDRIEILKDPSIFINDIENMMDMLQLNNFFGTITDRCNYIYSKYNPRLNIFLDNTKYDKFNCGKNILFCSHSNVQWIMINLDKADDNELYFDEDFQIDMYWIIEFLARRRNSHPNSLYYMNQYITCQSEYGVYRFKNDIKSNKIENIDELMKIENDLFKLKCLSYSPDNNIDHILENLYTKLNNINI